MRCNSVLDINRLTTLPTQLGQLTSLVSLSFSGNQVVELPSQVGRLTSLRELRLDFNKLTAIPSQLGRLTRLTALHLVRNQLTSLPSQLGQLTSLIDFRIFGNQLRGVPFPLDFVPSGRCEAQGSYSGSVDETNCFTDCLPGCCKSSTRCAPRSTSTSPPMTPTATSMPAFSTSSMMHTPATVSTSSTSTTPNPTIQFASGVGISDGPVLDGTETSMTASLSSRDASTTVRSSVPTNAVDDAVAPSSHQSSTAIVVGAIGAAVALLCIAVAAWLVVRKMRPKSNKSNSIELQSGPDAVVPATSSGGQSGNVVDQYQSVSASSARVEYGQRAVGKRDDHYEELSAVASNAPGSDRQSVTNAAVLDVASSQQRQTGAGIPNDEELRKRGYSAISAVQRKQYGQRPVGKHDDHYDEVVEL